MKKKETLIEVLKKNNDSAAMALQKYFKMVGIEDWEDLTKTNIYELKEVMLKEVCPSSVRSYLIKLRSTLNRYCEEYPIPCKNYNEVCRQRAELPLKTYLTRDEIRLLENVKTNSKKEEFVKQEFLIGCFTGARISDIRALTPENISGNVLMYVSQKTSTTTTVPLKPEVRTWISNVTSSDISLSLQGYNDAVRRLCKRAGINKVVKVFKAGKTMTGEKWKFLSSHSARISFATNLNELHVPILDISRMLGHSSIRVTQRYIVPTTIVLSEEAKKYFE